MIRLLSEHKALGRLAAIRSGFELTISARYAHRAKSCETCPSPGACCLDAHFVNVHISRLEAKAIHGVLDRLNEDDRDCVYRRIAETVEKYGLTADGDTFAQTYACPLFEKGAGCLVHNDAKPLPCIAHACYETAADLPPDELLNGSERLVDGLNRRTYRVSSPLLPLPLAIMRAGPQQQPLASERKP